MERVTVPIPGRAYDVTIGGGVIAGAARHLPSMPRAERAFVVSDRTVSSAWYEPLSSALGELGLAPVLLRVPEGEEAKSLKVYEALLRQLAIQEAHRADPVIGLGGGAVGDLAGFVAATYMRGVPCVQIPTTLTAQVDASIGGKTAVNLPEGKNLVGAFLQPSAVLADVGALETLPDRDFRSGMAEVAKYGLTLDPAILDVLERDLPRVLGRNPSTLESLVARCVRVKARAVAEDERDAGARLILNYGHTLAHALERIDAYEGRSHGEAVAVGMVFAARLSEATDLAPAGLAARHVRLLTSLGLDVDSALPDVDEILAAFRLDKKYAGGLRFVLLQDVGRPRIVEDVADDRIRATLKEMGAQG
jgi:3-dehydroquinate synthase